MAKKTMWFYSTIALAILSLILGISLFVRTTGSPTASEHRSVERQEPRLHGTWISDRQRTIEMMPSAIEKDNESFQKLAGILGKVRVKYTASEMTIEFDDVEKTCSYTVVGKDEYSCVIRQEYKDRGFDADIEEFLQKSAFDVIHFENPDTYWVNTFGGSFVEYFKRVSD